MKPGSTHLLRAVIILIGMFMLGLCVVALPAGIVSDKTGYYRPILLGLYIPAIPFFYALLNAMRLLGHIDKNTAFSDASIQTLKNIKLCALSISALFVLGLPYIYYAADRDDAPGVVAMGLVITGTSIIIATFAATLQKLLQNAKDIKAENDLTV
jgi:MFS family permease